MTAALVQARVAGLAIVPRHATPLREVEAAGRLQAYPEVTREAGPLLMALIWVETGGKPIAFNVGNITARDDYNGQAWRPPWFEPAPDASPKIRRLHELMKLGKAPRAFRAYENFADGFDDFMRQMNRSFPDALAAAQTGNAAAFVDALSRKYSPDYGPGHYRSFETLQARFTPWFKGLPASHRMSHGGTSGGDSSLGALVFFGLLFAAAWGSF